MLQIIMLRKRVKTGWGRIRIISMKLKIRKQKAEMLSKFSNITRWVVLTPLTLNFEPQIFNL